MAGELGDISDFLKDGGVSNLDWLDVPEGPREPLPRQNLDVVPDLEAAWSHTDEPSTAFVPNTGDAPRTMGDMSEVHGPLRVSPMDISRTARLVMMMSSDPKRIAQALTTRFDKDSLRAAKTALSQVMEERGLLGGYYIAANDFPGCATDSGKSSAYVRKFASDAKFVLAKKECSDCINVKAGRCSVFHKEIVVDVPYTEELADAVEKSQAAKGFKAASSEKGPRERIRLALLTENSKRSDFTGRDQPKPRVHLKVASSDQVMAAASQLAKENDYESRQTLAAAKARPVVDLLRKEMLKGRSEEDLIQGLRLAFDVKLLQETRPVWEPVFKEAGLYGAVYMRQTDFDDCRKGADFVNKHASKVRAIVAGEKCASCIFGKAGRCLMYGRKLVASEEEVLTHDTVKAVVDEHKLAGDLPPMAVKKQWGDTPAASLKAIHRAAKELRPSVGGLPRGLVEQGYYGGSHQQVDTSSELKREIVKAASQYMNEGLYGDDLRKVLQSRFEVTDLKAAREELKLVIAEQGLQGIKYIDPTVYDDYGHGCATAGNLHRTRTAVQYAKMGSKCASCVHHTMPGVCSVLSKKLVDEPPYVDKVAEQKAVLASGASTEVRYADLVNNGLTIMQEYELQHGDGNIELNPEDSGPDISIEFGPHEVKLP